jgi:hypothetical protein
MQPIPIHDQATRFAGKRGANQDGKGNGLGIGNPGDPANTLTSGDRHAVAQPIGIFQDSEYGVRQYDSAGTLRAGRIPEHQMAIQPPTMAVRRLTPTECERLQGFPEVTKKCIIHIWNCTDLQKQNVLVETKCHKSQSNVLIAEENESQQPANIAGINLNASQAESSKLVLVNVLIDSVRRVLQIHSQEKLILSVNIAENLNSSHLLIQTEDFVRLSVGAITWLEQTIRAGRVGSHPSINLSSAHPNGSVFVNLFGQEIEELAKDAEKFTKTAQDCMKSITSQVGPSSQNCELFLKTLFSCVVAATNSFIPKITNATSSYIVSINTVHGYTDIQPNGKQTPDGPRYKALGNSMAVPVMHWIGERINRVLTTP